MSTSSLDHRAVNRATAPYGFARHTFGIFFLAITIALWTASNFLASTILSDDTFSKPYFITYFNTATFSTLLLVRLALHTWRDVGARALQAANGFRWYKPILQHEYESIPSSCNGETPVENSSERSPRLLPDELLRGPHSEIGHVSGIVNNQFNVQETFILSLKFCMLWFAANYFQAQGLRYTTVASATILMSTSGVWTLVFGSLIKVELFTIKKLMGVLASLAGIILVSLMDLSAEADKNRGSFPHKTTRETASGDLLALGSAILYGIYTTLLKKKIKDESKIDVMVFMGFVGLVNTLFLWPGFLILHILKIEEFQFPSTKHVCTIIMWNALISVLSDMSWAYAVLLTSPLLVTVGLSLSIPLSIAGQIFLLSQTFGALYWLGAFTVFIAFILINSDRTEGGSRAEVREE